MSDAETPQTSFASQLALDRMVALCLALAEVLLNVPYLVSGPSYMREDLFAIASGRINGSWYATDAATAAGRPVVHVLYVLMFGEFYRHAVILHCCLVAISAVTVVALYYLARRFLNTTWAGLAVLIWVVLPTHLTLDHWLAASNITIALLVTVLGLLSLDRRLREHMPLWPTMIVLCIALLFYEGLAFVAVPATVAICVVHRRRGALRDALLLVLLPILLFVVIAIRDEQNRRQVWAGLSAPLSANALASKSTASVAIAFGIGWVALVTWSLVQVRRRRASQSEWMMLVGAAIFVVGILPFLSNGFEPIFFGLGDRGNVMAAVGVCIALVGVARLLFGANVLGIAALIAVVLLLVPMHLARSQNWNSTPKEERALARSALASWLGSGPVVLPPTNWRTDKLGSSESIEAGLIIRSGLIAPIHSITYAK